MVAVSVVVPTFREAENIPHLTRAIDAAMRKPDRLSDAGDATTATESSSASEPAGGKSFGGGGGGGKNYELIFADDPSGDATAEVCAELAREFPVRLLTRSGPRGLSPAVVDGLAAATGEFVVVMDADLSHPPEKIPEMVAALRDGRADFVVGSRYVSGGETDSDWGFFRRLNSRVATLLALPLAPLADPMSGFFALRRDKVPPPESLSPIGYKIGLEIAVKAGFKRGRIWETPIRFRDRARGESKMTLREQVNYLRHLRRLFHHKWPKRMEVLQFCAVGGVGLALDVACYYLLQAAGLPHLWARALAFWPAVTSNWFLNRVMTFKTRPRDFAPRQWLKFVGVSVVGFGVNWGAYATLTSASAWFDERRILALLAGVLVGTAWNFLASDNLVFRRRG